MPLIHLLVVLLLFALLLWVIAQLDVITPPVKRVLNLVILVLIVLWLVSLFLPELAHVRIGT